MTRLYRWCPKCDDDVKAIIVVSAAERDVNVGPQLEADPALSCPCLLTGPQWADLFEEITADDIANAQAHFWAAAV